MTLRIACVGRSSARTTGPLTYLNLLRDTAPEDLELEFMERYGSGDHDLVHFLDIKSTDHGEVRRASAARPTVLEIHDYSFLRYVHVPSPDAPLRYWYHLRRKGRYTRMMDSAHCVVCHSRYVRDMLPGSKLVYIGLPRRPRRARTPGSGLLFVGRDHFQKGLGTTLRAMRILKKRGQRPTLTVAGEEYIHSRIIFRARAAGLDVNFMGRADGEELYSLYSGSRIFLRPSYLEAFGLSILEALSCGTPTVASNVGGVPEIIRDGRCGYLIPPGDARSLADRIERLLVDNDLWKSMSASALKAAAGFGTDRMWDQLREAYDTALNGTGGEA